jgi:hypothetical protein
VYLHHRIWTRAPCRDGRQWSIAGPRDGRGDRKAFAGSRAKDARDAKKTDPPHRTPPRSLEIAKDTPTAVDGYQGPTEIPAGANEERDLEAEAAAGREGRIPAVDDYQGPDRNPRRR